MEVIMFKRNRLFIVMAGLAGLATQSAQAITFRAEILRKQRQDGTYQMIYCLNDVHPTSLLPFIAQLGYAESEVVAHMDELNKVTQKQKQALYDALNTFPKDQVMVLVEDMHSDPHGRAIKFPGNTGQIMPKIEFIYGITQGCISKDIPVINLECRQNKSSMVLYLSSINQKNILFSKEEIMNCKQSTSDIKAESDEAIREIESYITHNDALSRYNALKIKLYKMADKSEMSDMDTAIQAILADAPLLDLKAINHIHASLDKQQDIVLIMGAAHTKEIVKVLSRLLDYEIVDEKGCDSAVVRSITKPSHIDQFKEAIERIFNEARVFDIAHIFLNNRISNNANVSLPHADTVHSNNKALVKERFLSSLQAKVDDREEFLDSITSTVDQQQDSTISMKDVANHIKNISKRYAPTA